MQTENYKQSRILKFFPWVSLIFVVVGEFFKVLHWPGASILLVLGSFVFSCFYLPLFTMELWKYLPNAKMKLLSAWIEIHQDELMANWELAISGQQPYKIEPLR
jgi:hypothetical protein